MNATDVSQIVRDPEEPWDDDIERRLWELADELPVPSLRSALKMAWGEVTHRFGVHTWVRHKRYDEVSDSLVDVGTVCLFCSRGRSG